MITLVALVALLLGFEWGWFAHGGKHEPIFLLYDNPLTVDSYGAGADIVLAGLVRPFVMAVVVFLAAILIRRVSSRLFAALVIACALCWIGFVASASAQSTGNRGINSGPGLIFPQPECKARPDRYDPHNSTYFDCQCPAASAWGPLEWAPGGSAGRGYCRQRSDLAAPVILAQLAEWRPERPRDSLGNLVSKPSGWEDDTGWVPSRDRRVWHRCIGQWEKPETWQCRWVQGPPPVPYCVEHGYGNCNCLPGWRYDADSESCL